MLRSSVTIEFAYVITQKKHDCDKYHVAHHFMLKSALLTRCSSPLHTRPPAPKKKRPATAAEVAAATASEKKLKADAAADSNKEQACLKYEAELATRSRAAAAAALPPRPDPKEVLKKFQEWNADPSVPSDCEDEEEEIEDFEDGPTGGVFYLDHAIPKALTQSLDAQFQLIAAHPNPDFHLGLCSHFLSVRR